MPLRNVTMPNMNAQQPSSQEPPKKNVAAEKEDTPYAAAKTEFEYLQNASN